MQWICLNLIAYYSLIAPHCCIEQLIEILNTIFFFYNFNKLPHYPNGKCNFDVVVNRSVPYMTIMQCKCRFECLMHILMTFLGQFYAVSMSTPIFQPKWIINILDKRVDSRLSEKSDFVPHVVAHSDQKSAHRHQPSPLYI